MDDYHIHTKVTDGKEAPEYIIKMAKLLNLKTIAFTEHISKNPTYDWFAFKEEINNLDHHAGIKVLVGVEAKVLNEAGDLNVNDEVMRSADIVLGACHGDGNVEWLLRSACDIIAHPQIDYANIDKFINCKQILEINSKHRLPFEILDKLLVGTKNVFSFGSDTHSIEDFIAAQNYFTDIIRRYPKLTLI